MTTHGRLMVPAARFAAVAALAALLAGCSQIEKPRILVEEVSWVGLSIEGPALEVTVRVDNPNSFPVEAEKLIYTLELDGVEVVEGRQIERASVPASGSAQVVVPVTVKWEGGAKALEGLSEAGEHSWRIGGSVLLRSGLLSKTFRFAERGKFDMGERNAQGAPEDL